jgi:predicted nucleic acid-binding protein
MIVLDTNVISALMRPKLHPEIIAWQDRQPRSSIWTTAISILEARSGIYLLPMGRRRAELNGGLDTLLAQAIVGRVLPFDLDAAEMSATIVATRVPLGRNIDTRDTQIAGIVMSRNATLATRNVRDFDDLDIELVNPWGD